MSRVRRITGFVIAVSLVVAGLFAASAPRAAAAATVCGSNYRLLGSYPLYSLGRGVAPKGERIATVNIYWNATIRQNCMVTSAYGRAYGVPLLYLTALGNSDNIQHGAGMSTGWDDISNGVFRYYAGPDRTPTQNGRYCLDVQVDLFNPTTRVVLGSRYLYRVHC